MTGARPHEGEVRINIDASEFGKVQQPDVAIMGDAIDDCFGWRTWSVKHNRSRASRSEKIAVREAVQEELFEKGQPQASICDIIREELPDDGIFVGDITELLPTLISASRSISRAPTSVPDSGTARLRLCDIAGRTARRRRSFDQQRWRFPACPAGPRRQAVRSGRCNRLQRRCVRQRQGVQRTRYGGREIASTLEN